MTLTNDPYKLILGVRFLSLSEAIEKLERLPWRAMREPILACLQGEAGHGAVWRHRTAVEGEDELAAWINEPG